MMSVTFRTARTLLLVSSVTAGIMIAAAMDRPVQAQAQGDGNFPRGRSPVAIVDGQYPASYFPEYRAARCR